MSIITNKDRLGNFTSSNIYRLLGINSTKAVERKKALTYIEECNMERELGISLGLETDARPLQWGKHCEDFAFQETGLKYTITSDITVTHPTINFWAGSADGYSEDAVFDLKCPMTRKSFFKLVAGENIYSMIDGFTRNGATYTEHPDADKYYWQLVSNAILLGKKYGELIVYMPSISDLVNIKEAAKDQYNWIYYASDIELPHLPDNCPIPTLNTIRFEIPQKDIDLLTECVIEAGKLLIPRTSGLLFTPTDGAIIGEKL
jgi:hypothetical protein